MPSLMMLAPCVCDVQPMPSGMICTYGWHDMHICVACTAHVAGMHCACMQGKVLFPSVPLWYAGEGAVPQCALVVRR